MNAFHNGAVFQRQHFHTGDAAAASHPFCARVERHFKAGDADRAESRDVYDRPDGMCTVKKGMHDIPPVITLSIRTLRPDTFTVVYVLPFRIFQLSQPSLAVKLPHFLGRRHKTVIFTVCINFSGAFNRFHQLHRFRQRLTRQYLAENMQSVFHCPDCKRRMFRRIICKHDGIHAGMAEKLVGLRIIRNPFVVQFFLLPPESLFPFVADCDDLCIFRGFAEFDH